MVVVVIEVPRVIAKRETLTRLRAAVSAVFGRQEIGVWANGQPVELDPFGMAMLTVLVAEAELLRAEQGALDLGQHGSPEVERG